MERLTLSHGPLLVDSAALNASNEKKGALQTSGIDMVNVATTRASILRKIISSSNDVDPVVPPPSTRLADSVAIESFAQQRQCVARFVRTSECSGQARGVH